MEAPIDIQKILALMPHRYPFLLVDRIIEMIPGERVVALKNVTFNEPFFQGHFPEMPVMPGVLIVEAMAQAGGVLYLSSFPKPETDYVFYFMGIDKARFRKPVIPGDQVIFELELLKARRRAIKMSGRALVDNQRVAEAELLATIGDKT